MDKKRLSRNYNANKLTTLNIITEGVNSETNSIKHKNFFQTTSSRKDNHKNLLDFKNFDKGN